MTAPTTDAPNDDETAGSARLEELLPQPPTDKPEAETEPERFDAEVARRTWDTLNRRIWTPLTHWWAAKRRRILGTLRILGYIFIAFLAGLAGSAIGTHGVGTAEFWKVAAAPFATIGAGLLAIGAATIAFLGVRYAQKVAISTAKATLRQQSMAQARQARQHAAQLEAAESVESRKHRRQVTFDAYVAASTALIELRAAYTAIDKAIDEDKQTEREKVEWGLPAGDETRALKAALAACERRRDECIVSASHLLVLGVEDSYEAVIAVVTIVSARLAMEPVAAIDHLEIQKFDDAYMLAIGSLTNKYGSERTPAATN